jgi:hypothetical protein
MGVVVCGCASAGACVRTGLALGGCIMFGLCSDLGPTARRASRPLLGFIVDSVCCTVLLLFHTRSLPIVTAVSQPWPSVLVTNSLRPVV